MVTSGKPYPVAFHAVSVVHIALACWVQKNAATKPPSYAESPESVNGMARRTKLPGVVSVAMSGRQGRSVCVVVAVARIV